MQTIALAVCHILDTFVMQLIVRHEQTGAAQYPHRIVVDGVRALVGVDVPIDHDIHRAAVKQRLKRRRQLL